MIYLIVSLICVVGIINALLDSSALDRFKNRWWNKSNSWKNKWKLVNGELVKSKTSPWYYLHLYTPMYIERFPYSSTILVSYTDGWHLLKNLQYSIIFFIISMLYYNTFIEILISFICLKIIFSLSFEILYKKIQNSI